MHCRYNEGAGPRVFRVARVSNSAVCAFAAYLGAVVAAGPTDSAFAAGHASDRQTEIWFNPPDVIVREKVAHSSYSEFKQLFDSDVPWGRTAAGIRVFKFYGAYIIQTSDEEMKREIDWLAGHHISIAVEMGFLNVDPITRCGRGIEGYPGDRVPLRVAEKLHRLGAELTFAVADEPLFFGHAFEGAGACRTPIDQLVEQVAAAARDVRSIYPHVKFLDIEPISNFPEPDWLNGLRDWLAAMRVALGQDYVGLIMDIAWWRPGWQARALALTQYLRDAGLSIGIIYDGDSTATSDKAWLDSTRLHWQEYEQLVKAAPSYAVFQSWRPEPSRLLPESSSDTFTNVILDYITHHR